MDARRMGFAAAAVGAAALAALVVVSPDEVEVEVPGDEVAAPAAAAPVPEAAPEAAAPVEAPPAAAEAPALYGVPTADAQARLKAAEDRPLTAEELLAGKVPERREAQTYRPAVVVTDQRDYRAGPGTGATPELPISPNVVGVGRALEARKGSVDVCMKWNAPATTGEESVHAVFTITPDGTTAGRITKVELPEDTTGRYQAFAKCLLDAVGDAKFTALHSPQEVVHWSFQR